MKRNKPVVFCKTKMLCPGGCGAKFAISGLAYCRDRVLVDYECPGCGMDWEYNAVAFLLDILGIGWSEANWYES
jgi:predicted RNA-binding Zn-ribbon protein involved in translation (DUF1610 family)